MCLQSLMEFHHCLFKILRKNQNVVEKELQMETTLTKMAPSPYLVDISAFAKFYEIPSLPFQDIKSRVGR